MRDILPKIKYGAFVINLDEYESIETHWTDLYVNGDNVTYFHSFEIECIPKEVKNFLGIKKIRAKIYDIQKENVSVLCGHFFIRFIVFILKYKSLLNYTNLFSAKEYE